MPAPPQSEAARTIVRPFTSDDVEAVATLCAEMQAHHGAICPPRAVVLADLLDLPPGVRLLVAEKPDGIVGLAFLSPLYPGPGLRKGLFLKELFVSAPSRRGGVGQALMAACARAAVRDGYGRIDFTAAIADPRLSSFYRGLGAVPDADRAFFRLTGAALAALGEP